MEFQLLLCLERRAVRGALLNDTNRLVVFITERLLKKSTACLATTWLHTPQDATCVLADTKAPRWGPML